MPNRWIARRMNAPIYLAAGLLMLGTAPAAAESPDLDVADDDLRYVVIDTSPKESFLGVHLDTAGRLFVGGREALFVYEPNSGGAYKPRRELYRFPDHTWIYDIAIRGDDIYVMTVSALYVIPGARLKRDGLEPKRLVWGIPLGHVHQCLHAMAWGPEGDLYFSTGDPLWYYGDFNRPDHWGHWTYFSQPDGTKTPYNGVGGVFRVRPDGSRFRVVATGLRNSCGLAFDHHWNLFTNDNDHEGMPAAYVPGRLLHVTPGAYFSWPRGWMLAKTPERKDLLETMFAKMGRGVPVGQTYYNEIFLPERMRDNLLVARWGYRAVTRYPLVHRGASFKTEESGVLNGRNAARPVGVAVGRGGRIFATVAYMAHNDSSPTYRSDLVMITRADDSPAHPFEPYEGTTASPQKLFGELSDPSWWRRYRAHVEILRRGGPLLGEATRQLKTAKPGDRAAVHLVHLAAAGGTSKAETTLTGLATHADAALRLQAIRALSRLSPSKARRELFVRAVDDANPQVRHAAVAALFDQDGPVPDRVVDGPARSADSYLRQAATLLLAEKAPLDRLAELAASADPRKRLAGVLAAGHRLTVPKTFSPLPDGMPLAEPRGPVVPLAWETVDLRSLGRVGNYTVAELWKHTPRTPDQERLFALLVGKLSDESEMVRLEAARHLSLLGDARSEPLVAKVRQASQERRLAVSGISSIGEVWVVGPFADGEDGFGRLHSPERGPVDLSANYTATAETLKWRRISFGRMIQFSEFDRRAEWASFYAYFRLQSSRTERVHVLVGSDDGMKVWHNGAEVWNNDVSRGALPFQDVIRLNLQPGSNDFLVRVRNRVGDCGLYLHYRTLGSVVATLPEPLGDATLAERLKAATGAGGQDRVAAEFLNVDWLQAARQGDAKQGQKLFQMIGCAKCHAVKTDVPVEGGPSLADTAKRFTIAYLVESTLLPNKQISPVFRATRIVTTEGKLLTGLVVGETTDKIDLLLPTAERVTINTTDIEMRRLENLSPMPQGLIKNTDELRDLLAYLLSEKDS